MLFEGIIFLSLSIILFSSCLQKVKFRLSIWPTRNGCASTKSCLVPIDFGSTALLCRRAKVCEKARTKLHFGSFRRLSTTLTNRMKAVGSLAMNRLFKPMVKKHLNQPKRYIVTRHSNRSKPKTVGARRQSSESGNPRSPNGENTWDIPGFGKVPVLDVFKLTVGTAVSLFIGVMNTCLILQQMASEGKKIEEEKKGRQVNRTTALFDEWREMRDSRKAVLHAHDDVPNTVFPSLHTWIVTNFQNLNKLIAMGDRSTVDQSTPAAESFVMVIDFFLKWEYYDDNKTIDSAQMKKYIGPEFKTIHKVLTEIRDEEEFKSRHQIDSDKLSDVLRFLDKMSKMETER